MRAQGPDGGDLERALGLGGALLIGLGSILGTGVFVSLGIAAGIAGPAVIVAVAIAAAVAAANGLSSAQLAAAHPVSGGTYEYAYRLVHPLAGLAAGWMFLGAKAASAATAALGLAGYALHLVGLGGDAPARIGLALALALAIAAAVVGGVRRSAALNAAIVAVTLAALVTFVVAGALCQGPAAARDHLDLAGALASPAALLHASALVFVAFTGYGRIATLGEEVRAPARTIPRAVVLTLGVAMLLYLGVSAVAVATVGADALAAATHGDAAPLEIVARAFGPPWIAALVGVGAITAMASVLLNLILGLSRVALAMARRGDLPPALALVDPRGQSPRRAVLAVTALILGLILVGDVAVTWSLSAFAVLVYYGLTNLAALRLPARARRYPRWIAAAGLVACVGLAAFIELQSALAGLGLLAGGLALRALLRRARSSAGRASPGGP